MNYDEATSAFVQLLYDSFSKDPDSLDSYYNPDSKLIVSNPDETQLISTSNRQEIFPKGEHKMFRCNGQRNGQKILGHVSGYFEIQEDETTTKYLQYNEMIIYMHSNENESSTAYQILYHSINLSNVDPTFQPVKKEPIQTIQKPQLVDDPTCLFKTRTCLAMDLPNNRKQASIIPDFEVYGRVTRYAIEKNKILIEYENPNSLARALKDGNYYWEDKFYIRIKQMENGFS